MQFINTIEAAYPGNNISVTINNIMSGSVVVNETTIFVDGDSSAADSHAQAMATAPASIFPTDTYGDVTTSSVTTSNATNPTGKITPLQWHTLILTTCWSHGPSALHWCKSTLSQQCLSVLEVDLCIPGFF